MAETVENDRIWLAKPARRQPVCDDMANTVRNPGRASGPVGI